MLKTLNLSLRSVWVRPAWALVSGVLLAGGLASGLLALLAGQQVQQAFARDQAGIDLVVGAKGDATALVMANLYHLEAPGGELPMAQVHALRRDARVAKLVPLALADNFRGYRIVGTTVDYLGLYGAAFADGQPWRRLTQVVVGAEVARATGIQVNNTFIATHGLQAGGDAGHKQAPLRVVGVLAPCACVLDRLILTPLESVWYVHDDGMTADDSERDGTLDAHRTVTAALLRTVDAQAAKTLAASVRGEMGLQAATSQIELDHWMAALVRDSRLLYGLAAVLLLMGGTCAGWVMNSAVRIQHADYALLSLLGASAAKRAGLVLWQAVVLALLAGLLGLLGGHAATHWLGQAWQARLPVRLTGAVWLPAEWLGLALTWGVALLAAAWPARRAAQANAQALMFAKA
jgi:putative ABC transport system permease protein